MFELIIVKSELKNIIIRELRTYELLKHKKTFEEEEFEIQKK